MLKILIAFNVGVLLVTACFSALFGSGINGKAQCLRDGKVWVCRMTPLVGPDGVSKDEESCSCVLVAP